MASLTLLGPTPAAQGEEDPAPSAPAARPIGPAVPSPSSNPSSSPARSPVQDAFTLFGRRAEEVLPSLVRLEWKHRKGHDIVRHGVIVDAAGHVLTAGAPIRARNDLVSAQLYGARHARARVVAEDRTAGLTLLHVPGTDLRPVRFRPMGPAPKRGGAASFTVPPAGPNEVRRTPELPPLRTAPMGLQVALVTADGGLGIGKVRAVDRVVRETPGPNAQGTGTVGALIEAGLAALPTDVGAPWLDARGDVVGLQITSGLGLPDAPVLRDAATRGLRLRPMLTAARAVPASVIQIVLPQLLARRPLHRAGLGLVTVPAGAATRAQLCQRGGCHVVHHVEEGGAADRIGLRQHDVILRVNGHALRPYARLQDVLLPYRPGMLVELVVLRRRKPLTFYVTLDAR